MVLVLAHSDILPAGSEKSTKRKSPEFDEPGFPSQETRVQGRPKERRTSHPGPQAPTGAAPPRAPDAVRIIKTVANYFGIEPERLIGKGRDKQTALARHIAAYLIREETGQSFAAIGRELGGKARSAILRGYETIAEQVNASLTLREDVVEIRGRLHAEGPP